MADTGDFVVVVVVIVVVVCVDVVSVLSPDVQPWKW